MFSQTSIDQERTVTFLSASHLADLIRQGALSCRDVLDAHLHQIAQHNPALNAIVTLDHDQAHRQAAEADAALQRGESWGPLHGVPIVLKDVWATAGLRTTSGYKPLANHIPQQDATIVQRLRAAGAILVGKTNTPMLARDAQCANAIFGRTNNPWNRDRTTGGSTGGGAAAVAAGLAPLDVGSDIGGSIRIPAHFCGVFGLKPTFGRVPRTGHIPVLPGKPAGPRSLSCVGPVARSIEDLRLVLPLIAGPDEHAWEVPPVPLAPVSKRPLQQYRLAWTPGFGNVPVAAAITTVMQQVIAQLTAQGGALVEQCPAFDFELAWRTWGELAGAESGAAVPWIGRQLFQLQTLARRQFDPMSRGLVRGLRFGMPSYARAIAQRDTLIATMETFLSQYDAWICPVTATPAFPHCKAGQPLLVDDQPVDYLLATTGFTSVFNLTSHPVVVIPAGRTRDGLPVGLQLIGRRWSELTLLNIAEAITEVVGGFEAPPGYGSDSMTEKLF